MSKLCFMSINCISGCEKNYFGDGCTPCDLPVNCEVCDVLTGSCYRCLSNLTGPDCVQGEELPCK